jgi:hypothetical protein
MDKEAIKIKIPSAILEKYSALYGHKGGLCPLVFGRFLRQEKQLELQPNLPAIQRHLTKGQLSW